MGGLLLFIHVYTITLDMMYQQLYLLMILDALLYVFGCTRVEILRCSLNVAF